jgi:uncharacterized protein YciI
MSEPSAHEPSPRIVAFGEKFYKKRFWVLVTTPVAGRTITDDDFVDHLNHQIALEKRGVLFAAGPLMDETGRMIGEGMFIIRAADAAEARAVADSDPIHARGLRTYTLRLWQLHEGRIEVAVDLSDSTYHLR